MGRVGRTVPTALAALFRFVASQCTSIIPPVDYESSGSAACHSRTELYLIMSVMQFRFTHVNIGGGEEGEDKRTVRNRPAWNSHSVVWCGVPRWERITVGGVSLTMVPVTGDVFDLTNCRWGLSRHWRGYGPIVDVYEPKRLNIGTRKCYVYNKQIKGNWNYNQLLWRCHCFRNFIRNVN